MPLLPRLPMWVPADLLKPVPRRFAVAGRRLPAVRPLLLARHPPTCRTCCANPCCVASTPGPACAVQRTFFQLFHAFLEYLRHDDITVGTSIVSFDARLRGSTGLLSFYSFETNTTGRVGGASGKGLATVGFRIASSAESSCMVRAGRTYYLARDFGM